MTPDRRVMAADDGESAVPCALARRHRR